MVKTVVVTGREVPHLWANKSQPHAKNSNGQLYFEDETLYSYGSHFPIAKHVKTKKGADAILFTSRGYSITTSKHISWARYALSRAQLDTVFYVYDPCDLAENNFTRMAAELEGLIEAAAKARTAKTKAEHADAVAHHVTRSNDFAAAFGVRRRLKLPKDFGKHIEKLRKAMEAERVKAEAAAKVRLAAERAKDAKAAAEWVAGECDYYPQSWALEGARLRVANDTLETSMGARVPLADAKRLFATIALCRETGEGVDFTKGALRPTIGDYQATSISADGTLIAGCHTIAWEETARIATQLGMM